ncbi:hypothetical protein QR98_0085730 [Sarcoptes scabiei]|uniref:Uncharacterized protein n=1 Tax=Sarcoptes scabiei TaxID=52283 RepID=A0A132AGH6_SARSC|nr:hypothetical protein QR98_0085730 [Sarcoptes scabiei]
MKISKKHQASKQIEELQRMSSWLNFENSIGEFFFSYSFSLSIRDYLDAGKCDDDVHFSIRLFVRYSYSDIELPKKSFNFFFLFVVNNEDVSLR